MMGLPKDMGAEGEAMCDVNHVGNPDERATARRMDTTSARDPARLPTCSFVVHTGCGCVSGVHASALPERLPHGVSVTRDPYRRTSAAICR